MIVCPKWRGLWVAPFLVLIAAIIDRSHAQADPDYWSKSFNPDKGKFKIRIHIGPTSLVGSDGYKIAHNLWYHVSEVYAVASSNFEQLENLDFCSGVKPILFPVKDIHSHYRNIQAGWMEGVTLWIDFPFNTDPLDLGLWAETLVPIYSQLLLANWKHDVPEEKHEIKAIWISNLKREEIQGITWPVDVLKIAMQPGLLPGQKFPKLLFLDDLREVNASTWLGFEHLLHLNTRYDPGDPPGGFAQADHSEKFRQAAYTAAGINPDSETYHPRSITYLMTIGSEDDGGVVNNQEVVKTLEKVGAKHNIPVRPWSATEHVPFASAVATAARSSVFVARHGCLLANSIFLPPGSGVVELIQHNWAWQGMDQMYHRLTESMKDIPHVAWRAEGPEAAVYKSTQDERYALWTVDECSSKFCLRAHERAGLRVNTTALEVLVDELLTMMEAKKTPEEIKEALPWPAVQSKAGSTGLWWDVK